MQAVLNAALPIFGLILCGYVAARRGLLDRGATDVLNLFAVYLALPALLFAVMSRVTPDQIRQGGFMAAYAGGVAIAFAAGFVLGRGRGERVAAAGIEGLNAGYPNAGFMGIPLGLLVFGEAALPAIVIAMLFTACVSFLFAVVVVESDVKRGDGVGQTVRRVALSLGRNPILIAPALGLAVALAGAPVPAPVERLASLLGAAASPVALVSIGLFLAHEPASGTGRVVTQLVALKLVGQPLATALLAFYVFDVPTLWAKVAVLTSALPIGTGPFTLAKVYGLDASVTSGAILTSHVASVVTVTALVALFG